MSASSRRRTHHEFRLALALLATPVKLMTCSDQDAGTVVASNSSIVLAMEQDDGPLTPMSSAMWAKSL